MDDLKTFTHGQEGTHYACQEMVVKFKYEVGCCGCHNHQCSPQSDIETYKMFQKEDFAQKKK